MRVAGRVTEFDPPKLTVKTEQHLAGGMDAPREIDMGLEKLECMLTLADFDADALRSFGLIGDGVAVFLRGAQQGRDGAVEVLVHGHQRLQIGAGRRVAPVLSLCQGPRARASIQTPSMPFAGAGSNPQLTGGLIR